MPGATFALAASSTSCTSPQYEFWLKRANGTWGLEQGWGGGSFAWDSAGFATGAYQLGVWARRAGATNLYDAYGITTGTVSIDSCISASLAPSVAAPQVRGVSLSLTASSSGCASPQYEFWLRAPGSSWKVVQPYSSTATWSLNTSLYAAGNFQVGVWARRAASPRAYDSFYVRSYSVSPKAGCVVSGVSANATSPVAVASTVTFAPIQAGCSHQ